MVDTPGMGGLGAGHAAATLGFLPFADGLLFVSDASSELTAPEIAFLRRASELCPTVLFAQTKIDLYPQWQRIMEINAGHLAKAGCACRSSASAARCGSRRCAARTATLNEASRVPELVKHLSRDVVGPAKRRPKRSVGEARPLIAQVAAGLRAEARPPRRPRAGRRRGSRPSRRPRPASTTCAVPGAKWSVLVGDRVADLSTDVNFKFRGAFRQISKMMDERIEVLTKGSEWDELTSYLQTVVADEVTNTFVDLEEGATRSAPRWSSCCATSTSVSSEVADRRRRST